MLQRINTILRISLGIYLLIAGTNYYLKFSPIPPIASALGRDIMRDFAASGLYEAAKILEIVIGALLVLDWFTPLCLTLFMPLSVLVFWLDMFTFQEVFIGRLAGTLLLAVNAWLMLAYLPLFRPMLAARAKAPRRISDLFIPVAPSR